MLLKAELDILHRARLLRALQCDLWWAFVKKKHSSEFPWWVDVWHSHSPEASIGRSYLFISWFRQLFSMRIDEAHWSCLAKHTFEQCGTYSRLQTSVFVESDLTQARHDRDLQFWSNTRSFIVLRWMNHAIERSSTVIECAEPIGNRPGVLVSTIHSGPSKRPGNYQRGVNKRPCTVSTSSFGVTYVKF